jgi:hypothetical protein
VGIGPGSKSATTNPRWLGFSEIIDADWDGVEEAFFKHAVKDAVVTLRAFHPMRLGARRLMVESGRDGSDIPKRR